MRRKLSHGLRFTLRESAVLYISYPNTIFHDISAIESFHEYSFLSNFLTSKSQEFVLRVTCHVLENGNPIISWSMLHIFSSCILSWDLFRPVHAINPPSSDILLILVTHYPIHGQQMRFSACFSTVLLDFHVESLAASQRWLLGSLHGLSES